MTTHLSPANSESSDASSIKALIDGGTQGFTEGFNLPRVCDVDTAADSTSMPSDTTERDLASLPAFPHHMDMDYQISDALDFPSHVADLWIGPPGHELPYFAENGDGHPGWSGNFAVPGFSQSSEPLDVMQGYKPDSLQVVLVKDMMLHKARELHPDGTGFDEVNAIIQSIFYQTKVDSFVKLFCQNFHPSCPIFHIPTLDADTITPELLLAVVCFGAMYAHDGTDKLMADSLLDIAELLVFSTDVFAGRYDHGYCASRPEADLEEADAEWKRFERLQAGYLIVVVQYWAGARSSKAHVMESRFCEVIQV